MWRPVWFIALKDTQFMFREKVTLLWVFLMPIVFFYFIGTLTSSFMAGMPEGNQTLICRHEENFGFLGEHLERRLGENQFDVRQESAPGASPGDAASLTIPADFGEKVIAGDNVVLQFDSLGEGLAQDLELLRVRRAAYTVLADVIAAKRLGGQVDRESVETIASMTPSLRLNVQPAGERKTVPSGFEHAIPGEMVMFTMLVMVLSGSMLVFNERKQGLLRRLASTPITRGQIVLGKWLGKMMLGLAQVAIGMLIATVLFRMDWGPSLVGVVVVLVAWAAFCASVGLLLGSVAQSEAQTIGLGLLATMMLAALGGCWWPIEIAPAWAQTLQKAMPSGWTMDAMHRLISFRRDSVTILPHVLALGIGAAIVGWIVKARFRYE